MIELLTALALLALVLWLRQPLRKRPWTPPQGTYPNWRP